MATTKSTTPRRKPLQHPQECPAAPVVQFPLSIPTPRQTRPEEVNVMICECAADGVRLRLMPDPDAMCRIMDETYGPTGWECRYYYMNGQTFCGTGVLNPYTQTFPRKDAKAPTGKYQLKDPKDWESALKRPGKKPDDPPVIVRYRPTPALTVDKLLRADDDHIIGVQFLQGERKVVWQAE